MVRRIVHLCWKQRLRPAEIAARVGVAPWTVHRVLRRCRLHRPSHIDRVADEPVHHYEHDRPGPCCMWT
jgi:hypothetical protein